jgi:hypothetical protein
MITVEGLRKLFDCDRVSGELRHRPRSGTDRHTKRWNTQFAGQIAGGVRKSGYRYVSIDNRNYLQHRIVRALETGMWPDGALDHINGDKGDNRPGKLRPASNAQNSRNRGLQANNRSGRKGVSWDASRGKWRACICVNGKNSHLGHFTYLNAAGAAYGDVILDKPITYR